MVKTRLKLGHEEFVGGQDQAQTGSRGVCGWSGPGPNWVMRSLWVVKTRPKLGHEEFVGGRDQAQTGSRGVWGGLLPPLAGGRVRYVGRRPVFG